MLTTVQDLGRPGHGVLGISPAGAADPIALLLGNRLLGNQDNAGGLEMTLLGGTFRFGDDHAIALTGSDLTATLDGHPVPLWTVLQASRGSTLVTGQILKGARSYMCVQGGIEVEPVLGSRSTHLLSGMGGYAGRALRKGDQLQTGPEVSGLQKRRVAPDVLALLAPRKQLRVTPGVQSEWFPPAALANLCSNLYSVTEESNRMGLRLRGPAILPPGRQLISEGAPPGAIQIPPTGQPIILFVDQQTAGGYPKLANVITCDLPSAGQLRPRDEIGFELVDFEAARRLAKEQARLLAEAVILL